MGLGHSPSIIVDGLIFHIDPNNPRCYSGSGNTIYNLVNPSIGGTFVGFTANPIDNTETRSLAYNGSTTYQEFYPIEPTRLTVSVWFKATGVPSLNDIYGGTMQKYGQTEGEQEIFNSLASAQRARERLSAREIAQFQGSSGANKTSLTSQTKGQL